jgi:2-C-methyl-D-erythritol 2,4-cyclodiphosphate synthase
MSTLVGIGEDSHAFEPPGSMKKLTLAGVPIAGCEGLKAHSDGDVVLHACFNAVSSALGGRSIGYHHPDTEAKAKGTASTEYVKTLREMLAARGYRVNNLSVSLEAIRPRLEPHAEGMRRSLAALFDLPVQAVGLTFTSGEGLSSFGRGEGIRAAALVSLTNE